MLAHPAGDHLGDFRAQHLADMQYLGVVQIEQAAQGPECRLMFGTADAGIVGQHAFDGTGVEQPDLADSSLMQYR